MRLKKHIDDITLWLKAARLPFCSATTMSVVIGTVLARYSSGIINIRYFLVALVSILILNVGLNLVNDYFDHASGNDDINRNFNAFSGGSRVIQKGFIKPANILYAGVLCFFIAAAAGLWLNSRVEGNTVLWIGITGFFLAFFYSSGPFKLGYTPFGEVAAGLGCGPLIVIGSYYIQTGEFSAPAVIISVIVGLLVCLILLINGFPDYEADRATGKKTLVVAVGKNRAARLYYIISAVVYLMIIASVLFKLLPPILLITLLSLLISYKAVQTINKYRYDTKKMLPANALTVALHLSITLLISISYLLEIYK